MLEKLRIFLVLIALGLAFLLGYELGEQEGERKLEKAYQESLRPAEKKHEGEAVKGKPAKKAAAIRRKPRAINPNTAKSEQLQSIEGIGEVLAGRIIASREEEGCFLRWQDLVRVDGIGEKTARRIEKYLRFEADSSCKKK